MSIESIIDDHPDLEREDVLAALEFAVLASSMRPTVAGAEDRVVVSEDRGLRDSRRR